MGTNLEFTLDLKTGPFASATRQATAMMNKMAGTGADAGQAIQNGMTGIAKVTGGAGMAAAKMGASFAISNKAIELTGKLITSLISKTADFFRQGMEAAGAYEDMSAGMRSFTANADLAAEAARQVAAFAETPPFGLEETEKTAQALLTTGTAVSNLGNELTIIGNLAAASHKPIEMIGEKLAEMAQKGEAGMEGLMPLIQGGVPIMEALAKVMGLPIDKVKQLARENRLSLGNVKAAFNELAGAGGQYANAMDALGNTTNGKIKALGGAWETLQRKMAEPLSDMLKPVLDLGISKVKAFTEVVTTGSKLIKSLWEADQLGSFMEEAMIGAFKSAGNVGVAVMAATGDVLVRSTGMGLDQVISLFSGDFNTAIRGVGEGLWGTLKWVVGNAAAALLDGFTKAGMALAGILTWAVDSARAGILTLYETGKSIIPGMTGEPDKVRPGVSLGEAMKASNDILEESSVGQLVRDIRQEAADSLRDGLQGFSSAVGNITGKTYENFTRHFGDFKFEVEDIFGAKGNFSRAKAIADEAAPGQLDKLLEKWNRLFSSETDVKNGAGKATAAMAGANTDIAPSQKLMAEAAKKAAEAALKLAEALKDSAQAAAQASGKYRESARLEQQRMFDERVKTLMEGGMSERDARAQALADSRNAAKFELDMRDPRKRARLERENDNVLKRMARGGDGVIDGVTKVKRGFGERYDLGGRIRRVFDAGGDPNKYAKGLGPAELLGTGPDINLRAGGNINLGRPARTEGAGQQTGLLPVINNILVELQTIRTQIGEFGII